MILNERVVVVTGASSGIGLVTAKALTAQGAKVALLARSTEAIEALAKELPGSLPVTTDVSDGEALERAITKIHAHYGRLDALVNNAGRSYGVSVENVEPKIFEEIFRLNVLAPIMAMQLVIPIMRAAGGGNIVNVNSGTAFMAVPGYSVYSASKRALMGFSLTARGELEQDKIVVGEVYPGVTATNFGKNRIGTGGPAGNYAAGDPPELVADMIIKALVEGGAQYFANDYLKKLAGLQ